MQGTKARASTNTLTETKSTVNTRRSGLAFYYHFITHRKELNSLDEKSKYDADIIKRSSISDDEIVQECKSHIDKNITNEQILEKEFDQFGLFLLKLQYSKSSIDEMKNYGGDSLLMYLSGVKEVIMQIKPKFEVWKSLENNQSNFYTSIRNNMSSSRLAEDIKEGVVNEPMNPLGKGNLDILLKNCLEKNSKDFIEAGHAFVADYHSIGRGGELCYQHYDGVTWNSQEHCLSVNHQMLKNRDFKPVTFFNHANNPYLDYFWWRSLYMFCADVQIDSTIGDDDLFFYPFMAQTIE